MAGVLTLAERATGADYDYGGPSPNFIPAPHQDKVEFASGWYVRGDLAYAAETFPKLSSNYTVDPSISPAFAFDPSSSVLNSFSAGAGMGTRSTIGSGRTLCSIIARRSRPGGTARR
jgi:hypothetical protein